MKHELAPLITAIAASAFVAFIFIGGNMLDEIRDDYSVECKQNCTAYGKQFERVEIGWGSADCWCRSEQEIPQQIW